MDRQGRVGLIHKNGASGELVKPPQGGGLVGGQRLIEPDRSGNNNWGPPKRCQVPQIVVLEIRPVVQLSHYFLRLFTGERQRFSINLNRLCDNIGIRQYHKNAPQSPAVCLRQQMCHHGSGFTGTHRAVARNDIVLRFRVPAIPVHRAPQRAALVKLAFHRLF